MKRLISVLLLVVVFATLLTACGSFECDICGEKKSGKKHEENVFGQTIVYCDECYKDLEEIANYFG